MIGRVGADQQIPVAEVRAEVLGQVKDAIRLRDSRQAVRVVVNRGVRGDSAIGGQEHGIVPRCKLHRA